MDKDDVLCLANPGMCAVKEVGGRGVDAVKNGVGDALSEPIENLVNGMLDRAVDSLVYFMTFWLRTPSASLDESDPVGAAIVQLQGYMNTITVFFAVMGVLVAAGRMAWMARVEPVKEVGAMFLRVMFVQAAALLVTQILLRSGDAFSPWLVETALGNSMNHSIVTLMPFIAGSAGAYVVSGQFVVSQGVGAMLIIGIIILIASALQVLFLLLRDVLLAIILAFLPTLAAASLFKSGAEGFEKALGWIVALSVYKPVAAAIYVLGTLMVQNVAGDQADPGQQWMAMLLGTLTLILAVFAMPALVKFVAPAAGRGVSSAFSGGAGVGAAAGVVASGAAVAAIAGTGGAAAPAAAGAGGAGAGAGAGAGGAGAGAGGAGAGAGAEGAASAAPAGDGAGAIDGAAGGATSSGGGASSGGDSSDSGSGGSPSGWEERESGLSVPGGSAGGEAGDAPSTGSDTGESSDSGSPESPSGAADAPGKESGGSGATAQAVQGVASQASDSSDETGAAVEDMT